ncbi:hypothetical protein J6590_047944 [Homalodisca vitripennis]|nr:hypothetical protein J6590_047944 [Homalodisca vitripennis]
MLSNQAFYRNAPLASNNLTTFMRRVMTFLRINRKQRWLQHSSTAGGTYSVSKIRNKAVIDTGGNMLGEGGRVEHNYNTAGGCRVGATLSLLIVLLEAACVCVGRNAALLLDFHEY